MRTDFAAAVEAYLQSIRAEPWRAKYNRFSLLLLLRRQHLDERPSGLADEVSRWPEDWSKTVAQFLLGWLDEDTLFARAAVGTQEKVIQQHCEAYYYAGMVRLCREDVPKAI